MNGCGDDHIVKYPSYVLAVVLNANKKLTQIGHNLAYTHTHNLLNSTSFLYIYKPNECFNQSGPLPYFTKRPHDQCLVGQVRT